MKIYKVNTCVTTVWTKKTGYFQFPRHPCTHPCTLPNHIPLVNCDSEFLVFLYIKVEPYEIAIFCR